MPPRGAQLIERFAQFVGRGEALARVAPQAAVDGGREARLDGARLGEGPGVRVEDGRAQVLHLPAVVRRMARAEVIEERAEGIDVGAEGGRLAAPDLGRHVERRAHHRSGQGGGDRRRGSAREKAGDVLRGSRGQIDGRVQRGRAADDGLLRGKVEGAQIHQLGEAEVEELRLSVVGEDGVRGLDVAVEDAAPVRGGEAPGEALRDAQRPLPGRGLGEPIQGLAADELRDQVRLSERLADPVDGDDVGMLEPREGPRFEEEALPLLRVGIDRGDELHRHRAIEERVVGEVDLSHAAAADGPDQAVAVELLERRGGGLGDGAHLRKRP